METKKDIPVKETPIQKSMRLITEFNNSEEGKKHMSDFVNKIIQKEARIDSWVDRFWNKYKDNLDFVIDKIVTKYKSKAYKDREFKIGYYDPRERLYDLLLDVAKKYGKELTQEEYEAKDQEMLMFTQYILVLGSYEIELVCGQGSYVHISKIK